MKKVKDAKVEAITASELKKLQEMVGGMNQLQTTIGGYEAQKHDLLHQLAGAKNELSEFQKELTESYGDIQVDLKDGTISPADADNKED
jgi:allophanate hydrolase subunit 1|tara:strand:- start:50 stop:316 length:267 start_codon:yes stop_codon:yes gene_type:complete